MNTQTQVKVTATGAARPFDRCGHLGTVPRNMGRGAARDARIDKYFDRFCRECALERQQQYFRSLTKPVNAEKQAQDVDKLKRSY